MSVIPISPRMITLPVWRGMVVLAIALLSLLLSGCDLPQVSAEERIFLNLSLDYLDTYELPPTVFEGTAVRGLSAIAYDRQRDRIYVLSDDRSNQAPARFYTVKLTLDQSSPTPAIATVEIEKVTTLLAENGAPYPAGSIDPEGFAISPRQTVFVASEGDASAAVPPFIDEFDLETGTWKSRLPIPTRFLPQIIDDLPSGNRQNLSFEALTLNPGGYNPNSSGYLEPFRVFAATESSLHQDQDLTDADAGEQPIRSRLLHYLVGEDLPTLISEHLYLIDPPAIGSMNGLVELLTLDQAGHFLSLERSFGISGFGAQIYQIATGSATDISGITSLKGDISGIQPILKQLLLDLGQLEMPLDNLEGMTLGPQLPDGSQSLVLVTDDNFNDAQTTQLMLFRLHR